MPFNIELLKTFPEEPGVYLMKNQTGEVLYIGKAKDLKARVKQYFIGSSDQREMIPYLLAQVEVIETIITFTEKEALILESNLIKQHQPKYNVLLKDDKTFISLMVNQLHEWPQVKLVRYKGKAPQDGIYFGPYPSSYSARKTLEVLQKVFPLRQCSDYELTHRKKPCLLYDMKRCLAPCVNKCTKETYQELVKKTLLFLRGKDDTILQQLKQKMDEASRALEFEQAEAIYSIYRQVKEIYEHHQFVVQMQVEDCDVFAIEEKGPKALVVILKFRDGKLAESRNDFFPLIVESKESLLSGYLLQHYQKHEAPKLIILPFLFDEVPILQEILKEHHKSSIQLLYPLKGSKRSLLEMAEKNCKTLFEQQLQINSDSEAILTQLEEVLQLSRMPMQIECFDTSNIANYDAVAAMVVATEGRIDKKKYRLYKIKQTEKADDYTAMKEILCRRYERAIKEGDLPDLIVIDGGKGQLNLAKKILQDLNIASIDLIAITKEDSRHDKGMTKERIFVTWQDDPIELGVRSPLLFFLQKLRDEAHRMAITYHRKLRSSTTLKSGLDKVPGIGEVKKKLLLQTFGSLKMIEKATDEELLQIKGLSKKDIRSLREYFSSLKKPPENL
jgi:excinuclease ABC subunit C